MRSFADFESKRLLKMSLLNFETSASMYSLGGRATVRVSLWGEVAAALTWCLLRTPSMRPRALAGRLNVRRGVSTVVSTAGLRGDVEWMPNSFCCIPGDIKGLEVICVRFSMGTYVDCNKNNALT